MSLKDHRVEPGGSNLRACTRTFQGQRSEVTWVKTGPISDDMEVRHYQGKGRELEERVTAMWEWTSFMCI